MVIGMSQSLGSVAQIVAPAIGGFLIGKGLLSVWTSMAALAAGTGLLMARWGSSRVVRAQTEGRSVSADKRDKRDVARVTHRSPSRRR